MLCKCYKAPQAFKTFIISAVSEAARRSKGINSTENNTDLLMCDTDMLSLATMKLDKYAQINTLSGEITIFFSDETFVDRY